MRVLGRLRAAFARHGVLLPSAATVACACVALVLAHYTYLHPIVWPMNFRDEGYITAFADRMIHGRWLPYVDAVSHRGPMLYWVASLAVLIGGSGSFVPVRILALACSLLVILLAYVAAARSRRALAGAIAAGLMVVELVVDLRPDDGLAFNGEPLLDVFALGGLLCLVVGLAPDRRRPSLAWVAAAGVLVGLAALTKQVAAVTFVPLAFWTLSASLGRDTEQTRLRRLAPTLALAGGAAAPVLVVIARYAFARELWALRYYLFTYNTQVYLAPYGDAKVERVEDVLVAHAGWVILGALLVLLGAARALAGVQRGSVWKTLDQNGFLICVALSAASAGLAANASLRDFPHYYLEALPWFALLLGLVVEELVVPMDASVLRRTLVHAAVLLPLVLIFGALSGLRIRGYVKEATLRQPPGISYFVQARTHKDDAIYVWGFAADIYTFCNRRAASRYVFSTFVSGYVPFNDGASRAQDEARTVPGSRQILMSELESEHAAAIIDMPGTMGGRSMTSYPDLAAYLKRFCPPIKRDGVDVFFRPDPSGACASQ
jgi:4-amino-4-deoxy-L-arabinose transferase-like glycosyltransferase